MNPYQIHAVSKAVWILAKGFKGAQRRCRIHGGTTRYYVTWPRTMQGPRQMSYSFKSLPQWTPMQTKEPNPFAMMIPGMYRGFLSYGNDDSMMECAELAAEYMGISGAAHVAEFAASDKFRKLAVEILGSTDHPAKLPLSDHFLLLVAGYVYGEQSDKAAYHPTARERAQEACALVAKYPIIYSENNHESN
jgi:hypothetical protein